MATVTHAATATWSTTGGNTTNVATPAVGDLIVVIAPSTGVETSAVTDNNKRRRRYLHQSRFHVHGVLYFG